MVSDYKISKYIASNNPEKASKLFRQTVLKCCAIASIKKEQDEVTISVLWDYVKNQWENSTFKEIETAVMMNVTGKLPERIEHFQLFDVTYLSKVMEQYLIFKTATRQRVSALLPPKKEPEPDIEKLYEGLKKYYQAKGEFPEHWNWNGVYQYMDEMLMIEETMEQKKELHKTVNHRLKNKLQMDLLSVKSAVERMGMEDKLPEQVKTECRKLMVQKYIKKAVNAK